MIEGTKKTGLGHASSAKAAMDTVKNLMLHGDKSDEKYLMALHHQIYSAREHTLALVDWLSEYENELWIEKDKQQR